MSDDEEFAFAFVTDDSRYIVRKPFGTPEFHAQDQEETTVLYGKGTTFAGWIAELVAENDEVIIEENQQPVNDGRIDWNDCGGSE